MPHNDERRHHISKMKFQVTNWAEYEAGLRRRGSLILWVTEAAIDAWTIQGVALECNAGSGTLIATRRAGSGLTPCIAWIDWAIHAEGGRISNDFGLAVANAMARSLRLAGQTRMHREQIGSERPAVPRD